MPRPFLLQSRSTRAPKTNRPAAEWLVLAYLAGDNDL